MPARTGIRPEIRHIQFHSIGCSDVLLLRACFYLIPFYPSLKLLSLYIVPFSSVSSFCFSDSLLHLFLTILIYFSLCLRSGTNFSLFFLAISNPLRNFCTFTLCLTLSFLFILSLYLSLHSYYYVS